MKWMIVLLLFPLISGAQPFSPNEIKNWKAQSKNVTIIRDNWGIPHIYGKSDADAVFGLLYAQCEDDFKRVELNYIEKLGRLAEINGEKDLYNDLLIRLLIDTTEAKREFANAEPWLKKLLQSFANGINFYLYNNPAVKPALIKRFEPWYPLLWTDGSISAISTGNIGVSELKQFYGGNNDLVHTNTVRQEGLSGSNGFAIAPSRTASGNSILYINPHVTFYFRPEVHVSSEEGLNAYGAVTWGQFFVYQGFNEHCGWMHTSSDVDVSDMYIEKIVTKKNRLQYQYEKSFRDVKVKKIAISYFDQGVEKTKEFETYFTHHGPVMAKRDNKWISVRSYNRSLTSLVQSWKRTKAKGFEDYKKVMDLKANTSNSTVFADRKNIAYWHGNHIPVRDTSYNWSKPVDGSIRATEYKGLHEVNETVHVYNPPNGWIQNCNSTPFTAAGAFSPKKENYPIYMAPDGENFRGINAVRVLSSDSNYTIDKVIQAGYDNYLAAFEVLIPSLVKAYGSANDSLRIMLQEPIKILSEWDFRTGESSVATTLAIEWAQKLNSVIQRVYVGQGEPDQVQKTRQFALSATPNELLEPLAKLIGELNIKYGTWKIGWGEINRFQRISGDLTNQFSDQEPSLAVPFASSAWGMLPSFNSRYVAGSKKRYGYGGNSFVCAVEFGDRIKAKSLLAGGQSGDPNSPHFKDQAPLYVSGQFKDVLFYKEDVMKQAKKVYHPGENVEF